MSQTIEPARSGDLPAILSLLERGGLPAAGLDQHLEAAVVAREGTRVLGCAAVDTCPTRVPVPVSRAHVAAPKVAPPSVEV